MSDDTPTPSEIRDYAAKALPIGRVNLLERIMSDIDGMVHQRREDISMETIDADIGTLAAAITGIAAILHSELEREQ